MAGLERRLERLEEHWLLRARIDRNHSIDSGARHGRSLIPDGGWLRSTAEREVAPAIYNQQPGRENIACPSRWRESLLAGIELRAKVAAIPGQEIGRTADAVAQS
jgi:hypothetical protein